MTVSLRNNLLTAMSLVALATAGDIHRRMTHTALTAPMKLYPGEVANKYLRLEIPKGPISIVSFEAGEFRQRNKQQVVELIN